MFDFSKLDNQINILSGRNGHGKTSFLEMILLGLYGTGFPSRTNKTRSASIISLVKPDKAICQVTLSLLVGQDMVRVTRNFCKAAATDGKLASASKYTSLDLFETESGQWSSIASGKVAVDKWITANVGSISSFLLSCMVSQNADSDFFSLGPTEQKELLDGALNIGTHTRYMELLKESRLAHMAIADLVGAMIESLKKGLARLGPDASDGNRLAELELKIKEVGCLDLGSSTFNGQELLSKSHYEDILRTCSKRVVSNETINELAFELELLKRNRNRVQASVQPVGTLAEVEKELVKHLAYTIGDKPTTVTSYCPSDEVEFKRIKKDVELFEGNTKGHDDGPYNNECLCCVSRQENYKLGQVWTRYVSLWHAKKEYLEK